MVRKFLKDVRGNYSIATAVTMVPLLGGLALGIDYAEMSRQRQATIQALEAAGLATAWQYDAGHTDEDGENTYYTPTSVTAPRYSGTYWNYGGNDLAGSKAIYSSFGYLKPYNSGYATGRLFLGTSNAISKTNYSNGNYGAALNEHMAALCNNAKDEGIVIMTVALDLDPTKEAQKKQIGALSACASNSSLHKDQKLFWNAKGGDLAETFKKIADELSNLRVVG